MTATNSTTRITRTLGGLGLCATLAALGACSGAAEDSASSGASALSSTAGLDQPLLFDAQYYESLYPDLQAAFGSDLQAVHDHWLANGIAEGRRGSPVFDCHLYLQTYSDLSAAFGTDCAAAMNHFVTQGLPAEGRRGSVEFDARYYLSANADLTATFGASGYLAAANHFMTLGLWSEGRAGSSEFDVSYYVCHYPDLVTAFAGDHRQAIQHWNAQGLPREGRRGSSTFDVQTYIARYADLQAAFGGHWQDGIDHFVSKGIAEGRSGDPGDGGGPNVCPGAPIALDASVSVSATGFPSTWFGFPVPDGGQAGLRAISGTVTVVNSSNEYAETLFILDQLPTGDCPAQLPADTPPFGPAGTSELGTFIVKAPSAGTFTVPVNILLPASIASSSCILVGIGGGPVATAHPTTSSTALTARFGPSAGSPVLVPLDGEFCFGQTWGCEGATADPSQSFARVSAIPISQPATLTAIYGDISDTTFDGTGSFAAPPAQAWSTTNEVFLYHAADCAAFGGNAINGPAGYLGQVPASAVPLLSVPATGSGVGVESLPVDVGLSVPVVPGDCIVSLFGVNGPGGFDNESQLMAMVQMP